MLTRPQSRELKKLITQHLHASEALAILEASQGFGPDVQEAREHFALTAARLKDKLDSLTTDEGELK